MKCVNVLSTAWPCQECKKASRAMSRNPAPSRSKICSEGPCLLSEGSSLLSTVNWCFYPGIHRGIPLCQGVERRKPVHLETFKAFSLLGAQRKRVGRAEAEEVSHTVQGTPYAPQGRWTGLTLYGGGEGDGVARWLRTTKKLTLPLPPYGIRTQVRLFMEELHFPEAPASRCSQVTGSQSVRGWDAGDKAGSLSSSIESSSTISKQRALSPAGCQRHRMERTWDPESPPAEKTPAVTRSTGPGPLAT